MLVSQIKASNFCKISYFFIFCSVGTGNGIYICPQFFKEAISG